MKLSHRSTGPGLSTRAGIRSRAILIWFGLLGLIFHMVFRLTAAEPIRPELLQRFVARTWTNAQGVVLRYRWYQPSAFQAAGSSTNRWPLVVVLHGAVGRGEDNAKQFAGGNQVPNWALTSETNQSRFPCFVMAPQCPRSESWNLGESRSLNAVQSLVDFLELAPERHVFDTNRIYLIGLSMGGAGAWNLAAVKRELFAAVVPICGAGDSSLVVRLKDMPVWCFHGDADPLVGVEYARRMIRELRQSGATPRYTEYAGVGHASYEPAFREVELLPWLFSQNKARRNKSRP